MRTLAKEPGRENVEVVSANLVAMPEVTQTADVLWPHLCYHALHTTLIQAKGATAANFIRAVDEQLKPGGSYVIVDHAATAGAGTGDSQSLHRIVPASVREEVEAAGFVLDGQSILLANKDDPPLMKVFDPSVTGQTGRFVYRFERHDWARIRRTSFLPSTMRELPTGTQNSLPESSWSPLSGIGRERR